MCQFSDGTQGKYLFKTLNLTVSGDSETRSFKRTKELAEQDSNQKFLLKTSDDDKCYNNKEKIKQKKAKFIYLEVSVPQYSHWKTLKILEVIMSMKYLRETQIKMIQKF